MSERYFLGLLVFLSSVGAVWVSATPVLVSTQIWIAVLVALLGLVTLGNLNNKMQSSVLMPLYFIVALAFSLYVYLTNSIGVILKSVALLALVGLVLSFGVRPGMKKTAVDKAAAKASAKAPSRKKKASKKKSSKRK